MEQVWKNLESRRNVCPVNSDGRTENFVVFLLTVACCVCSIPTDDEITQNFVENNQ